MIKLDFEKMGGIIPAIVQDYKTNEVLMLAFMNEEAWERTLETGLAHYYSRTRKCLWQKGKSSGHIQKVKEIYVDCDKDTVLLKVEQIGAACHTGYRSCFYRKLEGNDLKIVAEKVFEPEEVYKK
ncbi:MAG: phosphoribosyl-AMP cyclohydrolase [Candidatus Desulfofervidus auxilii]|nr:phosphoribosyl-AMP cyclohydrolase [Candidatus Desulfofervidus auxilii]